MFGRWPPDGGEPKGCPPPRKPPPGDLTPCCFRQAVKAANGPTVQGWDDKNPVMRNLSGLYEVGIDEAFRLPDLPPGSRRLIEAERGHVLLAGLPRGAFTDLVAMVEGR